ncbi:MAG: transporter substrate-binding domain-containing protein [Geodermatophilaceae bacterium]
MRTNFPEVNLVTTDVYSKCADQLKNGEVVAVTTDNVILTAFVATDPESFELVGAPFTEEPYGIGLALDDDDFRDFINDVLEEAYESGAWADAYDSTVGAHHRHRGTGAAGGGPLHQLVRCEPSGGRSLRPAIAWPRYATCRGQPVLSDTHRVEVAWTS